jgi:hypothetical protein
LSRLRSKRRIDGAEAADMSMTMIPAHSINEVFLEPGT